ncbi:MAG: hypothetical protein CMM01_17805 [Rhodopirellula sp.]|nr:hypothetical protein [Rhodopirellula sp.]
MEGINKAGERLTLWLLRILRCSDSGMVNRCLTGIDLFSDADIGGSAAEHDAVLLLAKVLPDVHHSNWRW